MTHRRMITMIACALGTLWVAPAALSAQLTPDAEGFLVARPEDTAPAPGGSRTVRILGNQSQPGIYVLQITWAPGTGSMPHFHDQDRYIHVIKGTWWVQTGAAADVYNPEGTIPVEAGTFIFEPANGHHYDMAKDEEVIVQIWGIGPVNTTSIPQPDAAGAAAAPPTPGSLDGTRGGRGGG